MSALMDSKAPPRPAAWESLPAPTLPLTGRLWWKIRSPLLPRGFTESAFFPRIVAFWPELSVALFLKYQGDPPPPWDLTQLYWTQQHFSQAEEAEGVAASTRRFRSTIPPEKAVICPRPHSLILEDRPLAGQEERDSSSPRVKPWGDRW